MYKRFLFIVLLLAIVLNSVLTLSNNAINPTNPNKNKNFTTQNPSGPLNLSNQQLAMNTGSANINIPVQNISNLNFRNITSSQDNFQFDINKITTDSAGNIYMVGSVYTFDNQISQLLIIKYAPNGTRLWLQIWSGYYPVTEGFNVMCDSNNNVYVLAYNSNYAQISYIDYLFDAYILKFDSSGNLLWSSLFEINSLADKIFLDTMDNSLYFLNIFGVRISIPGTGTTLFRVFTTDGTVIWNVTLSTIPISGVYAYGLNHSIYLLST